MRTYRIEQRELAECPTAVMRSTLAASEIGQFVGHAIGAIAEGLARQGSPPTGPPFARYHRIGEHEFAVEAGFPTTPQVSATGELLVSSLPGGHAVVINYTGPYDQMEPAYGALAEWIAQRGGAPTGDPWEVYFSDPAREPDPRRWRTEIVMPFHTV